MKRFKSIKVIIGVMLVGLLLALSACGSSTQSSGGSSSGSSGSGKNIVFIPKMTGNAYFESGNKGAQDMAKKQGFTVKYDGSPQGTVANQVQIINSAINSGANAIAISSVSADGLNTALQKAEKAGIKVVTWDSDVNPKYRSIYVDQGTPQILGKMLVDMAAGQMADPSKPQKVAWFYSSPTVPDQNSWVDYATKYIKQKYPNWTIVTKQYGEGDAQKSLQIAKNILNTYPDINAIICPDSTALPAMAQAAEDKGLTPKDVAITGFAAPNSMKQYVNNGTIKSFGLWDVTKQGALSVYIANYLAEGHQLNVGDSLTVPGIGKVTVQPNTIQGYTYTAKDSGIVVLPKRIVFTKDNINNYNF